MKAQGDPQGTPSDLSLKFPTFSWELWGSGIFPQQQPQGQEVTAVGRVIPTLCPPWKSMEILMDAPKGAPATPILFFLMDVSEKTARNNSVTTAERA